MIVAKVWLKRYRQKKGPSKGDTGTEVTHYASGLRNKHTRTCGKI